MEPQVLSCADTDWKLVSPLLPEVLDVREKAGAR